ncbi:MAG: HD domain-containing protein [Oscillospiraceae bacterium]|nr:HD domain-containing protein [Oscillospiraceae bacterium]
MITKAEFIASYNQLITRKGADKLLQWLEKQDFFTAPASTRYHLACEGGLMQHSWNVYQRLRQLCEAEVSTGRSWSDETIAICGLLHDLCKVGYYKQEMRNVKVNGTWEQQPFYTVDEQFPYGHGEKSVFIAERFIRLTSEEAVAIRYHMGGFDAKPGDYSISKAYEMYPLGAMLHSADLLASYLDETRG